jgi:predicted secreted protein
MGSTSKWREFIPGMLDAGECTADVIYDGGSNATNVSTFLAAQLTQTAQTVTVTFPDNGTWTASGFITSLGHSMPYDDKVTQSVGLKFTGAAGANRVDGDWPRC